MFCVSAFFVPMTLSSLIYLHLTQGQGIETDLALIILKIGSALIVYVPWVFFLITIPFRWKGYFLTIFKYLF